MSYAPFAVVGSHCFMCAQYQHFFLLFCRNNKIAVVFVDCPVRVTEFKSPNGQRYIMIDKNLFQPKWIRLAYEIVGLPISKTISDDGDHPTLFNSLN